MSRADGYEDTHAGEQIDGECPLCHLPVYRSDSRRWVGIPPGSAPIIYHSGCAIQAEGLYWEREVKGACDRLRGCGYVVELKIIRPVR